MDKKGDSVLEISQVQETILSALRFRPRYGLEILYAIEASGGKRVGFSSLYPNLKKLEQRGLVISRWPEDPSETGSTARRRYYQITGQGVKALDARQQFLHSLASQNTGLA